MGFSLLVTIPAKLKARKSNPKTFHQLTQRKGIHREFLVQRPLLL
jgi:hypothetical protein